MIRPLGDYVLIEVLPLADMSAGGLHLPVSQRGRKHRAKVLAVGTGKATKKGARVPIDVAVGDTVVFNPYGQMHPVGEGSDQALIPASEIVYVEGSSGGTAPSA